MTEQHEMSKVESTEEKQVDQFDSASEVEDDLLQTSINNVASLDEVSLYFRSVVEIQLINQD